MSETPDIYCGRVGHDVSEGHCSCGGFHRAEDGIQAGTKTVLVGRIEYSPDYKSDFDSAMKDGRIGDAIQVAQKQQAEYLRLQSVVVEKAKARRAAEKEFDKNPATAQSLLAAEIAEDTAVDALIAFEKEHKLGE